MHIKENEILFSLYSLIYNKEKNFTSDYTLANGKINTSLGGDKVSFKIVDEQLIANDNGKKAICEKELSLSEKKQLSNNSSIVGLWKENNTTYEFRNDGSYIVTSTRKGKKKKVTTRKWLLNSKNTLMVTPSQKTDRYQIIYPVTVNKNELNISNGNTILKRVK
jgi:hypothetical protein